MRTSFGLPTSSEPETRLDVVTNTSIHTEVSEDVKMILDTEEPLGLAGINMNDNIYSFVFIFIYVGDRYEAVAQKPAHRI